jgi:flavin reductase (DIM6/NTAB) family NADH-FMN oxidoreductase RutF
MPHSIINPAVLYWGTPVVLITTTNPDLTSNIAPMSSAFWVGNRCILGLGTSSQTTQNLLRTGECVLNLASDNMANAINSLSHTTGTPTIPEYKLQRGYRYEKDKWTAAKLTPQESETVHPLRIRECQVQMEAIMRGKYDMFGGALLVIEVEVLRTHVEDNLRLTGHANRIDPDAWRPMIMSFQQLYGLKQGRTSSSKLAEIDEELYRV